MPTSNTTAERSIRIFALALVSAVLVGTALANNVQIANSTLSGNDGTAGTVNVQFDITWENGWRSSSPNNWDAAWVFVKYRTLDGLWQHVRLNNTGHTGAAGSTIDLGLFTPGNAFNAATNPVIGVFIHRTANGTGTFTSNGTQLSWNYAAQGLNYVDIVDVQVFAIEMVYVPQGAFFVGSGGTESGSFTNGSWVSGSTVPFSIASEGNLIITQSAGALWGTSSTGDNSIGAAGLLAASFPKGFAAFYCMKYEVSQQGYVDFLNTLTYTQQLARTRFAPSSAEGTPVLVASNAFRSGMDIQTPGTDPVLPARYACNLDGDAVYGEAVDGKDIACNGMKWGDLGGYLDWSGLRPMTELEFEKACRGTASAVANEYPWGTSGIASGVYTMTNSGANNEGIATNYSTTLGNAANSATRGASGPVREGIFAGNAGNTGRVTAGSSFYGIMEFGGNTMERVVSVGNATGRSFTGVHGNGSISAGGEPDAAIWPLSTDAVGMGSRGGSTNDPATRLRISDRNMAGLVSTTGAAYEGGRGARKAP